MKMEENKQQLNIGADPVRTPVLYSDAVIINSDEFGMTLDFAQKLGGTNQAIIVARIGLSKEHAKKLAAIIAEKLASQGEFFTSKVKLG